MQTYKSICPYDCPASCGLLVTVEGGKVVKVTGDAEAPPSYGLICHKMRRYEQSIHDSRRIVTPLRRTGSKGAGQFAPISWKEAIEIIVEQLQRTMETAGPDAVFPLFYSGVMGHIQRNCGEAFFNALGACGLVKTLCSSAKGAGYAAVMGKTGCLDPRELAHSDMYIVWGSNMKATRLQSMPDIARARKDGKRVVLIETDARDMTPHVDAVVLVRPGTDGALALAMMHVLAAEGLDDAAFLRREAEGFDAFKATLGAYTPEWGERITGVPAQTIVTLAKEYGAAKAPAIILGSGNSRYGNGGMTVRCITILSAFTGAWSKPGGGLCGCSPGGGNYIDLDRIMRPDLRPRPPRMININQVASALENPGVDESAPYIEYLHVWGCNPVGSIARQQGIRNGLQRDDLFIVVHERFMTDTARYADIILPATFSVEHTDCHSAYGYCTFGTAYKIIPAPGACKSNWDIFRMLATATGYAREHFDRSEEDMLADLLAHPTPALQTITDAQWSTLRKGGLLSFPFADHTCWQTPSGKIQIVNDALAAPMPQYQEAYGGVYPLRLVAVPSTQTLNSIFLERDALIKRRGAMSLAMHPDDAQTRGIADGDSIIAHNDQGEVPFTACVTPLVSKGVVTAAGVYDSRQSANENLANTLHYERLSDIGQATTMNDNTVDVKKA